MRIDLAFCIELEKTVDIYKACQEFSAQTKYSKFHFLCSDPVCRETGTRVSGVNHQYLPEDDDVLKSPHYRMWDIHSAECEWVCINEVANDALHENDSESAGSILNKKNRKLITKFILPDDAESNSDFISNELTSIRKEKNPENKVKKIKDYLRVTGSTATCLESLVSCFEELKAIDRLDENLTISGYGETTFKTFFKQLKFAHTSQLSVIHGGARIYKRYSNGVGFSLNFLDKYNKKHVSMYVSSDMLKNSKNGGRILRIVDEVQNTTDSNPYLKVYWIGGMHLEEGDSHYKVNINTLAHVVMKIVYPKTTQSNS